MAGQGWYARGEGVGKEKVRKKTIDYQNTQSESTATASSLVMWIIVGYFIFLNPIMIGT